MQNVAIRVLRPLDFGITGDFEVARIQLAIEEPGAPAARPVAVRLHTLAGELLRANLIRIAEEILEIPDPAPAQVEVSFSNSVVPMGHALVIEVLLRVDQDARDQPGRDTARFLTAEAGGAEPELIDTPSDVQLLMTIHGREH